MKAKENRPVKKVHLTNFHIAGFSYWDGPEAFDQLKVGTRLDLVREPDNQFDPYAVAVYLGDFKLGFIPRGENHDISKYLDMGLDDISKFASSASPRTNTRRIRWRLSSM